MQAAVTIVVDNFAARSGLRAEHGLSLLLETRAPRGEYRVLLDTGASDHALLHNLERLEIDPDSIDAVVLSHGHYDHSGGLLPLLARRSRPTRLVVHPLAWGVRLNSEGSRDVGPGFDAARAEQAGAEVESSPDPIPIADGVQTLGAVPRNEPAESGVRFRRVLDGREVPDSVEDDLSLLVDLGPGGLVILTGCCHAGIINTVNRAWSIAGGRRLRAVIGGLHLIGADADRMARTIAFLEEAGVELAAPLHCTGRAQSCALAAALPGRTVLAGAGSVLELD